MDDETDQAGNDAWIEAFWADARVHARVNELGFYLGSDPGRAMRPPAWSFGADPETADELAALVVEGTKTATASALRDYGDEELPRKGALSIILDGAGHPVALIATTQVRVVPFGTVDAEHARREGEGDLSLVHWREVHRSFFATTAATTGQDPEVTDETMVVLEEFEVLWPL